MSVMAAEELCKSTLWERIDGWEVVIAVLFIMAAWSVVQVARMYYMAEIAKIGRQVDL